MVPTHPPYCEYRICVTAPCGRRERLPFRGLAWLFYSVNILPIRNSEGSVAGDNLARGVRAKRPIKRENKQTVQVNLRSTQMFVFGVIFQTFLHLIREEKPIMHHAFFGKYSGKLAKNPSSKKLTLLLQSVLGVSRTLHI